jgi:Tfp pilus assembly protein PilO
MRSYRELVVAVVVLIGVFVGFLVGVVPAAQAVFSLRDSVDTLETQTTELRVKAAILSAIDEQTYKRILADLVTAVPADQSLTSLFSTIDGLAAQSTLSVTDLGLAKPGSLATESARKQSSEEKQIGSNLLPFSVTIAGTYDQIREFLAQVIRVRRFFRVRSFNLTLIDPTNVSVRMAMDAFYAPYVTSIAGVDKKIDPLNEKDEQTIAAVAAMPLVGSSIVVDDAPATQEEVPTAQKQDPFSL